MSALRCECGIAAESCGIPSFRSFRLLPYIKNPPFEDLPPCTAVYIIYGVYLKRGRDAKPRAAARPRPARGGDVRPKVERMHVAPKE